MILSSAVLYFSPWVAPQACSVIAQSGGHHQVPTTWKGEAVGSDTDSTASRRLLIMFGVNAYLISYGGSVCCWPRVVVTSIPSILFAENEIHSMSLKGCPSLCRILPLRFALDDQCGCCHSTSLWPATQWSAKKRTNHSYHIDRLWHYLFECACQSRCGIQMINMS
jgi:hypothetical protein